MRTAYAEPNEDMPEEEGSPDAWFSGYLEGRDEAWTAVSMALGKYAPRHSSGDPRIDEASIVAAIITLVAR